MKPKVLCMTRPHSQEGVFHFPASKVSEDSWHWINRSLVDHPEKASWASQVPQVLGYVVIVRDGKYLSYSRQKPTETRLSGKRSIGVGGHVEISDMTNPNQTFEEVLRAGIYREIQEELGMDPSQHALYLDRLIVSNKDEVSSVHLGYAEVIYLIEDDAFEPNEELYDVRWVTFQELKETREQYENWSQILIDELGGWYERLL